MRASLFSAVVLGSVVLGGGAVVAQTADAVGGRLESARAAYAKGNLSQAVRETEMALAALVDRLGKAFLPTLPPPLHGWKAEPPEILGLGQVGGGLSVSRVCTKGDETLNITLILDNHDERSEAASVDQPNTKIIKIGDSDAVLRYDPVLRSGEIVVLPSPRLRLEIQGDDLDSDKPLLDSAHKWDIPAIRRLIGE